MADGPRPRSSAGMAEPPRKESISEPPSLDAIRVKGPGARSLNKPAILTTAAGGIALVLLLASGAFSSDNSRKPAEIKPMMSDPARPEVAQGAVRSLPADYSEAAVQQAAREPATPPQLGPPLPGDVAAFAPRDLDAPGYSPPTPPYQPDWNPPPSYGPPAPYRPIEPNPWSEPADPAVAEAREAERASLFFSLREEPGRDETSRTTGPASQQASAAPPPPGSPFTVVAPQAPEKPDAARSAERAIFPGAVIPASLVTELNSESPGPVIAQVTQSIYDSATGRTLLIPQGARLIGDYRSVGRYGQNRVAIVWGRLIMPNGDELALDETALDPSGAAGITGQVDNHWGDVFGAAFLGTLINIGVATTEEPQLTYGSVGVASRDPVDAAIAGGVQRGASIVTNRVVDRSLAIPPTIRVEAGKRITVIVTRRTTL